MSSASPQPRFEWPLAGLDEQAWPGDPALWLSLATGPLLLGLIGGRIAADLLLQVGLASEELFRGDRLPLLDSPIAPPAPPPSDH